MKCDICGERPAVVFIHQVGNSGPSELHLCEVCAQNHGLIHLSEDVGKALVELLKNFPQKGENSHRPKSKKGRSSEVCLFCGSRWQDIQRSGKVGCDRCYTLFKDNIRKDILPRGGPYRGRLSVAIQKRLERKQERERLERLLQQALEQERYEEAALYRDAIQQLGKET